MIELRQKNQQFFTFTWLIFAGMGKLLTSQTAVHTSLVSVNMVTYFDH